LAKSTRAGSDYITSCPAGQNGSLTFAVSWPTASQPTPEESARLEAAFDKLFSTRTGFDALDSRIAKTQVKKESLLMVLKHPEIPLHNNPAKLEARQRVRKHDIQEENRPPG
jgi:hypothetical protein